MDSVTRSILTEPKKGTKTIESVTDTCLLVQLDLTQESGVYDAPPI